ncbi:MAG TPA: FAD-dependent oxidoreductase [Arcobacter sp.]|nr:FAD-dependent oxidoreductase [Arcobacter sp.]
MYDVLIIGNGGAGLSSAISLHNRGFDVAIVSKTNATASQTSQAQGGINAVLGKNDDTVANHINDTLKSANKLGNEKSIFFMCEEASSTIKWLDTLGVPFSRDENSNIAQRQMGGASNKRACYSADYTGLKILHTLFDTALALGITFIDDTMLLNLIVEDEEVKGITALDIKTSEVKQILSKATIVASGGYGGVYHNYSTNSSATTSDGIIASFNAGVELENMEFVQFHPTALKDKFILISESARGEGGYLVTSDEKRFVDELLPRDIVAREIYTKLLNRQEVFLDIRHLGLEKIMHLMPQEYKLCEQFTGLKMDKDLIPITPASHYTMGGIKVKDDSSTNIKSLYAIGECSSNGVHGANRLGGNSLLEIITFGKSLGDTLCISDNPIISKVYEQFTSDENSISNEFTKESKNDFYKLRENLGKIMYENVGLFKNDEKLNEALNTVLEYKNEFKNLSTTDKSKVYNTNLKELLEFKNMIVCAEIIISSALNRTESRGAHYRSDFPDSKVEFEQNTISSKINDVLNIRLEDVK